MRLDPCHKHMWLYPVDTDKLVKEVQEKGKSGDIALLAF